MATDLKLPELGEGVHEGEMIAWKVKVGDVVKDDQPICEIMTDKATVELPAPFHGTVVSLNAKLGDTVKVGQAILTYEVTGGAAKAAPSQAAASSASKPSQSSGRAQAPAASSSSSSSPAAMSASASGPVAAAPSTRKFARESGVDLAQVPATGPHGRVMREDVEKVIGGSGSNGKMGTGAVAASLPTPALPPSSLKRAQPGTLEERIPFRGLRKKISEKMRLSKDHAAHFTYVEECDATELVKLRSAAKDMGAKYGIKVTYLPFVMKAMVAALRKYPILNSELDEQKGEIILKHYYNIGLSIQTDDGLTAPVVKDVASKSVLEIAKEIQALVEKARAKKLVMEDFQGSTITLTNAGSIGGLFATPVINYPEVAILGFNKIFRKPVVKEMGGREEIVIRDWTYFSISLDHRIVDGAVGAEFMKTFISYIENPSLLVLEP
jgi:pyruvate dehydrogenase E2 component (dihydrolipoamide acetyltransferase)